MSTVRYRDPECGVLPFRCCRISDPVTDQRAGSTVVGGPSTPGLRPVTRDSHRSRRWTINRSAEDGRVTDETSLRGSFPARTSSSFPLTIKRALLCFPVSAGTDGPRRTRSKCRSRGTVNGRWCRPGSYRQTGVLCRCVRDKPHPVGRRGVLPVFSGNCTGTVGSLVTSPPHVPRLLTFSPTKGACKVVEDLRDAHNECLGVSASTQLWRESG